MAILAALKMANFWPFTLMGLGLGVGLTGSSKGLKLTGFIMALVVVAYFEYAHMGLFWR